MEQRKSALEKLLLQNDDIKPNVNRIKKETHQAAANNNSNAENLFNSLSVSKFDALLIKSVRERPSLYNSKRFDYRDPEKRNSAWAEIAAITGMSVQDCHVRWKQLRDRYVREKKFEKTNPGSTHRWHLTKAMDFIGAHIRHRRRFSSKTSPPNSTSENATTNPPESNDQAHESMEVHDSTWASATETENSHPSEDTGTVEQNQALPIFVEYVEGADSDSFISAEPVTNNDSSDEIGLDPSHPASMVVKDTEPEVESVIEQPRDLSSKQRQQQDEVMPSSIVRTNDTGDEDELFGLSIAATLRRLAPKERALAKVKIQEVLYNIEFGQ